MTVQMRLEDELAALEAPWGTKRKEQITLEERKLRILYTSAWPLARLCKLL